MGNITSSMKNCYIVIKEKILCKKKRKKNSGNSTPLLGKNESIFTFSTPDKINENFFFNSLDKKKQFSTIKANIELQEIKQEEHENVSSSRNKHLSNSYSIQRFSDIKLEKSIEKEEYFSIKSIKSTILENSIESFTKNEISIEDKEISFELFEISFNKFEKNLISFDFFPISQNKKQIGIILTELNSINEMKSTDFDFSLTDTNRFGNKYEIFLKPFSDLNKKTFIFLKGSIQTNLHLYKIIEFLSSEQLYNNFYGLDKVILVNNDFKKNQVVFGNCSKFLCAETYSLLLQVVFFEKVGDFQSNFFNDVDFFILNVSDDNKSFFDKEKANNIKLLTRTLWQIKWDRKTNKFSVNFYSMVNFQQGVSFSFIKYIYFERCSKLFKSIR